MIAGEYCRIAGNILVVLEFDLFSDDTWNLQLYEVNETMDGFVPYQDPIIVYDKPVLSMELRRNLFVYWDRFQQAGVIYQRKTESGPFFIVEQIFVIASSENQIAIHNDVLVVGGDNQTHVFSGDNSNWIEDFTLDQRYGYLENYQLSGQTLLATSKSNVYSYNIEECTQQMPTSSIVLATSPPPSPPTIGPHVSFSSPSSELLASASSPTACFDKILSNAQRIETSLDDPRFITMEVDGRTMVSVVQDGDGPVFVLFYKWANDERWQLDRGFDLGDLSVDGRAYAAISGNAAFVGLENAYASSGTVVVFHRNQTGTWEKMNDLSTQHDHLGFGYSIGIDGNLAFVATDDWGHNKILVFHRESNKWVQFDEFNGRCPCSIAGDVIVSMKLHFYYDEVVQLYKYAEDTGAVMPIQDHIPAGHVKQVDSSRDYFLYCDEAARWISADEMTSSTLMYRREDGNQTFAFLRQFNITGVNALSIHNDILVVSGRVFYLRNDGEWEETFTLGRRFDEYKLSGRFLLARTENEVYSFNIVECTQEMPTQAPSLSLSPSIIPSIAPPTIGPSLSVAPSLSSSPTDNPSTSLAPSFTSSPTDTCYWVVISIYYDYFDFSNEISWKLFRISDSGGDGEELVQSFAPTEKLSSYLDSICLPDGSYEFIIFDSAHDGLCCQFFETGLYSLSLNDGILIREGGEFESSESTVFSIPFVQNNNS